MPAHIYWLGAFAMISVSMKECMTGRTKKFGFRKVPSSLYMIDTEVHAAQFDAIVGNANTGLSSVMHKHFTVSRAFPPPTPNTISASRYSGRSRSLSTVA